MMKTMLKAITFIDLFISAFCWLILWFINSAEPAAGYKIVYVICMIHAAVMMYILTEIKRVSKRRAHKKVKL